MKLIKLFKSVCLDLFGCLIIIQLTLFYEWPSLISDLIQILDVESLSILSNFQLGFKCYAARKSSKKIDDLKVENNQMKPNLLTRISSMGSIIKDKIQVPKMALKSIARQYSMIKLYIKGLLWNILVLLGFNKILSPMMLKIFTFIKVTFSMFMKVFTIFNIIIAIWFFYFNTPVVTGKLILGWIGDFFRVAWTSYTDNLTKFFDYIMKGFENGFKSIPRRASNPIEYPNNGFIREFREVFRKLRELPPAIDNTTPRWYDSLRDQYKEPVKPFLPIYSNNPINQNNIGGNFDFFNNAIQFMKDYWFIGAIVGGAIITGGTIFYFWDPISSGTTYVASSIKDGTFYVGNSIKQSIIDSVQYATSSIKQGFTNVVQYFTTRAPDPDTGGSDNGSIVITDLNQENPNWDEIASRLPNVPNTPLGMNSGTSTPSSSGTITPGDIGTPAGTATPSASAPRLTLSLSNSTNIWDITSNLTHLNRNVANSPVLSNLPNAGSELVNSGSNIAGSVLNSVANSPVINNVADISNVASSSPNIASVGDIQARVIAPKLSISTSNPWTSSVANVADSPILSNIPNLGTELFSVNPSVGSVSNSPVLSNLANITGGTIHIPSESDTTQAINSLTQNASGPQIFPQDFDQSIGFLFILNQIKGFVFGKGNSSNGNKIIKMNYTLSDEYLMKELLSHFPENELNFNSKIQINRKPKESQVPLFEWINIDQFEGDFISHKNHILGGVLGHAYKIAIFKDANISLFDLSRLMTISITADKLYLDASLYDLMFYTNIEFENMEEISPHLLFNVFLSKALEERLNMIVSENP